MSPAALVLLRHSFRRTRTLIVGMGLVFGVFQVLSSLAASTFQESQLFSQVAALVPVGVRQVFGASFLTLVSFTGMVVLGYVHFAVTGSLVGLAIAVGTEPTAELERGFSDLLMARPVSRASVVSRSVGLLLVAATVVNAMMLGGTYLGLALFAPPGVSWPAARILVSLAGLQWMLMWCWGGVALAFGAAARRRGAAGAATGLLAVSFYLLDILSRVWKPGRELGRLSPFHYFAPLDVVSGGALAWSNLAVLAGIGACGALAAYLVYRRRDL